MCCLCIQEKRGQSLEVMSSFQFNDQSSIRSTSRGINQPTLLPRSTSISDLFAFPSYSHSQKRLFQNSENGVELSKSVSIPNLALIPEHKAHHRLTPYQIQRSHMKQSFQFPNGESFTPRRQLPKSASSVSLHRQRSANSHPKITAMHRSSSMVTVSLPQYEDMSKKPSQLQNPHSRVNHLPTISNELLPSNTSRFGSLTTTPRSNTRAPSLCNTKAPNKSVLTASSLHFNRLQSHQSQVSISSFSNKQTASSNDSQSTETSIKEICDPGSATSTDLSDEELTKKILSSSVRTQKIVAESTAKASNDLLQVPSTIISFPQKCSSHHDNTHIDTATSGLTGPTPNVSIKKELVVSKIPISGNSNEKKEEKAKKSVESSPVRRSSSRLSSFFRKLFPLKKKARKEDIQEKVSAKTQWQKAVTSKPTTSKHIILPSESAEPPSLLDLETEDDIEDDGFKDLMDIDLVFDSLLLKSEQHQQNSDIALINQFNESTRISPPTVEPPLRSSKRPLLVKDYQGRLIHHHNNGQTTHNDRIIEHLHQNWKAVHFNAVVPSVVRSNDSSSPVSAKKCRFNEEIYVNDTFSPTEYLRSDKAFPESRKQLSKSRYIDGIKMELNEFKKREMLVHPNSSQYTHFFL